MVSKQNRKILRNLGAKIHEERLAKGYSQSELAEKNRFTPVLYRQYRAWFEKYIPICVPRYRESLAR